MSVIALLSMRARAAWAEVTAAPALVIVADLPAARPIAARLAGHLPDPWRSGDEAALRKALAAAGVRGAAGLGSGAARAALGAKARAAAAGAGAGAVLFVGAAAPRRGTRAVTLLLVAPGEGEPLLDTTIEVPTSDDGAAVLAAVTPALARLAPKPADAPPPPTPAAPLDAPPAPGPVSSAPPETSGPRPLGGADRAIFVLSAGGGTGARVFRYNDGLSPQLRTYDLAASPDLAVAAELYPFARLDVPVLRGLGVTGAFDHALGVTSQTSTGTTVSTSWLRVEGDVRLRLVFGGDPADGARFILGLHGGVVKETFGFTGDPQLVAWLPDVDYLFGRAGADGRVRAGPIALMAGASYLPAISGGALADRFRQASFAAVELDAGLAVPLARVFELRATGDYTRVFYAFHPVPGDVYVAGGALDHLVRARLLATLLL